MYVSLWLKAFVVTLLIECPVAFAILRKGELARPRLIALTAFASLATHPLVWFVFPELPISHATSVALAEGFAVVTEAVFYFVAVPRVSMGRAAVASLCANAASFGAGLLLYRIPGGWLTQG